MKQPPKTKRRKPLALVSVQEKGYVTFKLSVNERPSHSSVAEGEGAIGRLARAVKRLENHPMPGHFDTVRPLVASLAGTFRFPMSLIISNLWLFEGLILKIFLAKVRRSLIGRSIGRSVGRSVGRSSLAHT